MKTLERDTNTRYMKCDGRMAEIRSTILRMTWRRSGAGLLHDVSVYCAYATVLEGEVSKTRREAPVEFWKKKVEVAVRDDLDWSVDNKWAKSRWVGSPGKDKESLFQSELDCRAQADKCRDEDEADKRNMEVKNGVENCPRIEMS